MKRKKLLAEASRTVCSNIYLINDFAGKDMLLEDIDSKYNGLNKVVNREVDTIAAREVVRLMQLGFFGKVKCCMSSNSMYYEMLDETDSVRMELLKPRSIIRNGEVVIREDLSHDPLRRQLAYAMKAELHMMIYVGMIGEIVSVDPDGKGVDITMQRFLMTSSWNGYS